MTTPHLPFWLAALYLPEIGPRTFLRWLEKFSDIEALFTAESDELTAAGLTQTNVTALKSTDWNAVANDLSWSSTPGNHIIALSDPAYPPLLKEISDPPLLLFVRGNVKALSAPQIAIVGARSASPSGLTNAEMFARALAESGLAVTSGLALGVDGASHRGVLQVRGVTLGICGAGLAQIYPRSHAALAQDIIANDGAIVSEFPLAMGPFAANFPRRNRIIAGLSLGVLVVEAALKSGSLITARHALESGREVFAIPGNIHNPLTRGCHHLIRQGAKLVETAHDILEELGEFSGYKSASKSHGVVNSPSKNEKITALCLPQRQVLTQIEYEITPLDVIVLRSGLTVGEVSSILLILELNGYIRSVSGGYVREMKNQ